jgi:hypothetical protein
MACHKFSNKQLHSSILVRSTLTSSEIIRLYCSLILQKYSKEKYEGHPASKDHIHTALAQNSSISSIQTRLGTKRFSLVLNIEGIFGWQMFSK